MALSLNTSHPLYGNLITCIGVDNGALVDLVTPAVVFTPAAGTSFGTGTYGEHFQSGAAGTFDPLGVSLSPPLADSTSVASGNPLQTIFVVVNDITATSGTKPIISAPGSNNPTIGFNSAGYANVIGAAADTTLVSTTLIKNNGAHSIAFVRNGESGGSLFVNGVVEATTESRVEFNSSTVTDYLMGWSGQGTITGKLVWFIRFDKLLSDSEIADLHASLGADNQLALIEPAIATGLVTQVFPDVGETNILDVETSTSFTGTGTPTLVTGDNSTPCWQIPANADLRVPLAGIDTSTGDYSFTIAARLKLTAGGTNDFAQLIGIVPSTGTIANDGAMVTRNGVDLRGRFGNQVALSMPGITGLNTLQTVVLRFTATSTESTDIIEAWVGGVARTANDPNFVSAVANWAQRNFDQVFLSGTDGAEFQLYDLAIWNRALTDTEAATVADNYRSTMPSYSSVTPVSFTGTIGDQTLTAGDNLSLDTSVFFTGTQTPFTYSATGLPAGASIDTNTGVITWANATESTTNGIFVTATDASTNTANSNPFSITVSAASQAGAYALNFAGETDGYADITDVVVADAVGFYKEFDFEISSYTAQTLCAQTQSSSNGSIQIIAANQIKYRIAGGTRKTVTISESIPLNTRVVLRLEREYNGTRNVVIKLNGNEVFRLDNAPFGESGGIDTTGVIGKTFDGQFTGVIYAADINGSVYLNTNDANASTWGDGTLVNMATDGSQWISYSAATPIAFSGTIADMTYTAGDVVNVDLSTYFSGSQTPFTFAVTAGSLTGSGLTLSSSGILSGTATESSVVGLVITGTDTDTATAASNAFNITVNAATAVNYALRFDNTGYVTIPSKTSSLTGIIYDGDWEFSTYAQNQSILGNSLANTEHSLYIPNQNTVSVRIGANTTRNITLATPLPLDTRFNLKVEKQSGVLTALVNDVSQGTAAIGSTENSIGLSATYIGAHNTGRNNGKCYRMNFAGQEYLNTTSSDTTAWGDGTLTTIPSTNWESYSAEPVVTPIAFAGTIADMTYTVGDAVSVDLSTYFSGTQTPFTFSSVGAAFASLGLSLSSAGVLSGTVSEGSVTGAQIRGTDADTATADSNTFNITVTAPVTTPIAFSGTIADMTYTAGDAVNVDLSTYFSGTQTPFTFSSVGASVASLGLSLSSAGVLSGTAIAGSVTGAQIRGTDADTATADSNTFNITVGEVPQGTVTVGAITVTSTTASVPFTYSAADETGYVYRLNGGQPQSVATSPINLTGLTASTAYTIDIAATNTYGTGTYSSPVSNFTTDAAPVTDGVYTSEPLTDNTGQPLTLELLDYVALYDASSGALVVRFTNITTDSNGVFVVTDALIQTGVSYKADWQVNATGVSRMPSKAAT